jgi:hypothetical protein
VAFVKQRIFHVQWRTVNVSQVDLAQWDEEEERVIKRWANVLDVLYQIIDNHPMVHAEFDYLVSRGMFSPFR